MQNRVDGNNALRILLSEMQWEVIHCSCKCVGDSPTGQGQAPHRAISSDVLLYRAKPWGSQQALGPVVTYNRFSVTWAESDRRLVPTRAPADGHTSVFEL